MRKSKYVKGYHKITRNRDKYGRILTYTVHLPKFKMEVNTLREAKIMAAIL